MRQWQPRLGVWAGERVEGLAELEQQLAIAIFTPLGSREGQPEFGSLVHDAVDDTLTNARLLVSREVQRVVKRWVPRVVLISVGATQDATGRLVLEIKWRPRDIEAAAQQLLRVVESERPAISTPGTAPVFTLLPTMTGDVLLGSTLTCDVGEYSGTDPVFVTYAWRRDGVPIVGATLTSYEVTLDDLTDLPEVDCLVTLQNAIGVTSEATDAVVHVPVAPSFATAPVIAGTFLLGQTLVCIGGTWTGTAPLTVARQWLRSGEPISGATNVTYVVQVADMLSPLTCEVTVTNMAGSDVAMSAERSTDALPPTFTTAPSISGTYAIGEVLTCAPGEWTGTESITVEYQWHRDGIAIGGEDESTYTVVSADYVDGTAITCLVTLTNSAGSDTDTSDALTCPTSPASILGASLLVWHPNGAWTTSGGLATQWDDLSAASRHVTAAGALRPIETAAVFGALPALTFAPGQALTESGAMLSGDADFSIWVYAKWVSVSTSFASVGSTAGTRAASTVGVWSGSRWYGGNDNISAVVPSADTTARLYSKTYSASVYEPRRSGVSEGSLGSGGALALGPGHTIGALRVDAGVPAIAGNAHVGEVVISAGVATGPQIAAMEAYFLSKFGVI